MDQKDADKIITAYLKATTKTKTASQVNALAINKKRHVNERRMAWASLIFMMVIVLVAIFKIPPEHIANYDNLFTNLFFALSGVVLGYMGFTTWGANKTFDVAATNADININTGEEPNGTVTTTTTTTDQEPAG